jgi:hypothetical protein
MPYHHRDSSKSMFIANCIIPIFMLLTNHVIPSSGQLKKHVYCKLHNSYFHTTNDCNVFRRQVQSAINEGQLKFAESPQMKLDKDPFPTDMNIVELYMKKIWVRPSQTESTKGKEFVVGEERQPRMIRPKKFRNWPIEEEREKQATISSKSHLRHPHG